MVLPSPESGIHANPEARAFTATSCSRTWSELKHFLCFRAVRIKNRTRRDIDFFLPYPGLSHRATVSIRAHPNHYPAGGVRAANKDDFPRGLDETAKKEMNTEDKP